MMIGSTKDSKVDWYRDKRTFKSTKEKKLLFKAASFYEKT